MWEAFVLISTCSSSFYFFQKLDLGVFVNLEKFQHLTHTLGD